MAKYRHYDKPIGITILDPVNNSIDIGSAIGVWLKEKKDGKYQILYVFISNETKEPRLVDGRNVLPD